MWLLAIDTTRLVFSDEQLKRMLAELKPVSNGALSSGEIAILGALIGALSAILSQLIIFILSSSKEKNKSKRLLIADERSLSSLIINFYTELAVLKVTYEFWYRSFSISADPAHYQQFLLMRDKIPECKRNITTAIAKYVKAVTQFIIIVGKNEPLSTLLNSIKDFPPLAEESSTFDNVTTIGNLNDEADIESNRLRKEYLRLDTLLSEINSEMLKKF